MSISYVKAPSEIVDLIDGIKDEHHPVLEDHKVVVDALVARRYDKKGGELGNAVKCHGYPATATIRVVPLKQRALGRGDALLVVDGLRWEALSEPERHACIDHELEHLQVVGEEGGVVEVIDADGSMNDVAATDDLGRPKLRLKLHDWQLGGFRTIVARHRDVALEVKAVAACRDEKTGQMFWDWDSIVHGDGGTEPLPFPQLEPVASAKPQRRGRA